MMPTTPSGTRILPTWMPLGRYLRSVISPTGSGSAAICSRPSAMARISWALSVRRSTKAASCPAVLAAATSCSVGREQAGFVALHRVGHRQQCRILVGRVRAREFSCRGARGSAHVAHVGGDIGDRCQSRHVEVGHPGILPRPRIGPRSCGKCKRRSSARRKRAHAVGRAQQDHVGAAAREQADGDDADDVVDGRLELHRIDDC